MANEEEVRFQRLVMASRDLVNLWHMLDLSSRTTPRPPAALGSPHPDYRGPLPRVYITTAEILANAGILANVIGLTY